MGKLRAAIYLRVSTDEQHPDNQRPELERYVEARGWSVWEQYVDHGVSGSKGSRPALDLMMGAARKRKFDVVLAWSVSRLGRSLVNNVLLMQELTELGVGLVFVTQGIDTTTTIGRGVVALLAALGEAELEERRERTKAGLRRARAQGKRLGRPKRHLVPVDQVRARLEAGESMRMVARDLGIPVSTMHRQMRCSEKGGAEVPAK